MQPVLSLDQCVTRHSQVTFGGQLHGLPDCTPVPFGARRDLPTGALVRVVHRGPREWAARRGWSRTPWHLAMHFGLLPRNQAA